MGTVHELPALRERRHVFADRDEAGRVLARLVRDSGVTVSRPLVLAIPAGGVPVAAALAGELDWPLDVCVVSKITLPWNTEAGFGAVAFDGTVRLNEALLERLPLTERMIAERIAATRQKVARRVALLRAGRPPLESVLPGRTAVLVDDGLASGFTMRTAVDAVRQAGAGRVTIAVPTGSADTVDWLAGTVDVLWCPNVRSGYPFAVADAYRHWYDLDDDEVLRILGADGGTGR